MNWPWRICDVVPHPWIWVRRGETLFFIILISCGSLKAACVDHQKVRERTEQRPVLLLNRSPTQQTASPTARLDSESSSSSSSPLTIVLFPLSLSLFVALFLFFANSYSREAHSHPKVSVGESCQRAQGLSKQGESLPLPTSPSALLPLMETHPRTLDRIELWGSVGVAVLLL